MTSAPERIEGLQDHHAFGQAVPTPDHFIPLLYLAGLASAAARSAEVLVDGYAMGSLSMTSYTLDADCDVRLVETDGSPELPHLPGDEINV